MRNYAVEFIGTFFLVLTIGLSVHFSTALAALAIGSILMAMVYMGGHISGAHYNPAVTTAIWIRGKISASQAIGYYLSQILGACTAGFIYWWMLGETFAVAPGQFTDMEVVVAEILFTFALAMVVLNVATHPGTSGNSFYGLAIGFTVLAGALSVGPVSGGAFNPAVGIGP